MPRVSIGADRMMTQKAPKVKPARAELTVSLCIAINHQVYEVTPILGITDHEVVRAWRLVKKGADGNVYDVAERVDCVECTCPDFEVRRRGLDAAGCKHCKALRVAGLIDGPGAPPAAAIV